jgi:general secretion pathway protein G
VSKGDLFFYILIGLIFEPFCLSVVSIARHAEGPMRVRPSLARAEIAVFSQALDHYKSDVGSFPISSQGLQALRTNQGVVGWAGSYLRENVPRDPWGRPYLYRFDELGELEILSLGRDGKPGGRGDDQDVSSLRLDEPIVPSAAEKWNEFARIAAIFVAPVCGVGYLFLPWLLYKYGRRPIAS